jgi:hypothetical protein
MENASIPIVETYRGVGIHDFQPQERIAIVKIAIDKVYIIDDLKQLFAFAADRIETPEARLFAAAKCSATWDQAVENREFRPDIDLALLEAHVAGLDSLEWIDPWHYGCLLDGAPPGLSGLARPAPLTAAQRGQR